MLATYRLSWKSAKVNNNICSIMLLFVVKNHKHMVLSCTGGIYIYICGRIIGLLSPLGFASYYKKTRFRWNFQKNLKLKNSNSLISVIGRNASRVESYKFAQIMLKTFRTQNYITIEQITFAYHCNFKCSSVLSAITVGGGVPISIFQRCR